jgi:predicted O-linked N-acetylglucosamine transferase (SPINDLY family)
VGVSLLNAVGLAELVASDHDDYVRIAVALANDRRRLAELRAGLRERMLASPLMDAAGFCRRLEAAYREMWHGWCSQARL